MTDAVETTPLLEGGLDSVQEASLHLKADGIEFSIRVAGDGVPGT